MLPKHLLPYGLILMAVCMSCSSTSSQPSAKKFVQDNVSAPVTKAPEAVWDNDLTLGTMFDEDANTKIASSIVEASLLPGQKAYTRYSIGNLAFAEIIPPPPPKTRDINGTRHYVAVILGDEPRLVELPSKALFAQFAENVRINPGNIEMRDRIGTALILATASDNYESEPAPTWVDENGTLTIHYHRKVSSSRIGRAYPILQACTLTVDANQDFTLECTNRGRGDM